ncbi:MAG: four helix bundle protein [Chitinophagaceae bacterium]|jgi:four helix bundle protein|nr:four helix bundle protein [Chitinophagaceae bacterium]
MENEKDLLEEAEKSYSIRHRCFHFAKDVVKFINECKYERIHFSLFDQLLRSATSIGANIVEGSSGSTKKDFINFLHISLKSANESKYWMCLIRDVLEVDKNKIKYFVTRV